MYLLINDVRIHTNILLYSVYCFYLDSEATANPDATKRMFFMDLKYCFQKKQSKHKVTGKYVSDYKCNASAENQLLRTKLTVLKEISLSFEAHCIIS